MSTGTNSNPNDKPKPQPGTPPERPAESSQGDDERIAMPTPLEPGDQNSQPT